MPTESNQRSYLRDSHGPRAVDVGQSRGNSRRHHRDSTVDERDSKRTRRSPDKPSSKSESSHRRKSSNSQSSSKSTARPSFELDVIGQPPKAVPYGMDVEASVMVSLRYPSTDRVPSSSSVDTSRLFAVASLVRERPSGERETVEAGSLTGQKLFDSVHAIPAEYRDTMARSQPSRLALGYFNFSGLLIRQPGSYRIRTTLIQMGSPTQDGTTVMSVDSEQLKVEGRPNNLQRPHLRVYA